MRFSPIPRINAERSISKAYLVMLMLIYLGLTANNRLFAQSENEEIDRFTACLPAPPEAPDLNVPTLCDEYGDIDGNNADVVIGADVYSETYSSTVKDPNGPIGDLGWYNQTILIYGTLIVDDETWFSSCLVRMMPGSKIIVETPTFLAVASKFFACNEMWEGIRFNRYSGGSIWNCHIEDANFAIKITKNVPINLVDNRFNRNIVGFGTYGGSFPAFATIELGYFWGNTFTQTSVLNAYYNEQTPSYSSKVGVLLRSAIIDLTSYYNNSPNRFINLDYGIHSAFGFFTVGNAEFIGQGSSGIWANRGTMKIPITDPCFFKDNYDSGITALGLTNFDVQGCTFDADYFQYIGILLDGGGVIRGNIFNLDASHLHAIRAERNNTDLTISSNEITISMAADGILVENVSGSAQGFCKITGNNIVMNDTEYYLNKGIHVVGGTADNYEIVDNEVDIQYAGTRDHEVKGIVFEQCIGEGHLVSLNRIFSTNDQFGGAQAILIKNVQNGTYCLNETDDTYEGMVFYGNNNPSRIEQNIMDEHHFSLIVEGDPAIAPAVVGQQDKAANYWEPGGYIWAAAICNGDPFSSHFYIHDPNIVYDPSNVYPSGWFLADYGTAEIECELIMASTNPFDDAVADGSFFDSTSTPLLEWEMNRYLYYKMLRDPNYGQGNNDYAAFFTSNLSTTSGAFAQVDRALYSAGAVASGLAANRGEYVVLCDTIFAQIQQLSASTTPPTSVDDDVSVYINAKTVLLDSINNSSQTMASAWEIHETNVISALQTVRTLNDGISTAYVFEANQKVLNELKIKVALVEPWTNGDLTALQTIASQSPDSAGTTVWQANAMLPRCYEASRSTERAQESKSPELKNVVNGIRAFPNPVSDKVNIEFTQPFTGTASLCDAVGKIIAKKEVELTQMVQIDVSRLTGGVYFLIVRTQDGLVFSKTVVVND